MTKEELDALYFEGFYAEQAGDLGKAMELYLRGATHGDDSSMNAIGLLFKTGKGVEQDKAKAIEWFKKSYRAGKQPLCCCNIAAVYAEIGNRRQAIHWWKIAIERGDGEAALSLAKYLMKSPQVLDLLQMAVSCRESLEICGAGKEQAEWLLAVLTTKGYG